MLNFKEYLTDEVNRTTDEKVRGTAIRTAGDLTLDEVLAKTSPTVWTGREISGIKYLVYNRHYLNITELKKQLDIVYDNAGYAGYGFSKLSEPELVRYTRVKDIVMPFFMSSVEAAVDPELVAQKLFMNELKEFDWKPEEY